MVMNSRMEMQLSLDISRKKKALPASEEDKNLYRATSTIQTSFIQTLDYLD